MRLLQPWVLAPGSRPRSVNLNAIFYIQRSGWLSLKRGNGRGLDSARSVSAGWYRRHEHPLFPTYCADPDEQCRHSAQDFSGHRTLDELYKYLEVSPDQVHGAIAALSMLTPVESEPTYFGKPFLHEEVKEEQGQGLYLDEQQVSGSPFYLDCS